MPVFSIAQLLPAHIIDSIIQHVPSVLVERPTICKEAQLPRGLHILVPLLQVCRSWRPVACAAFYSNAGVILHSADTYGFTDKDFTRVEDAIANGCRHCIRSVFVMVNAENFNAKWSPRMSNMASIIRELGLLRSVRSVTYYFTLGYPHIDGEYIVPDSDLVYHADNITNNINTFVAAVRDAMPRIRNVRAYNYRPVISIPSVEQVATQVLESVTKIIDRRPDHLSLAHIGFTDELVASPVTELLQSILLSDYQGRELETVLIQRNASTLEKLHIETASLSACLKLVWDYSQPSELVVFTSLKHMIIKWAHGQRNPNERHPTATPFPRLETLVCRGFLPFIAPAILTDFQTHLRHLDVEADQRLLDIYNQDEIFTKGSFKTLGYVSLRWGYYFNSNTGYTCTPLAYKSAGLSDCMHTLCLRDMRLKNISLLVSEVQFPQTLRNLDMANTMLSIDDAMAILIMCPQVLKANLSLTDVSLNLEADTLTTEEIVKYQDRYRDNAARIKYLGLKSWKCKSVQVAAEFALLLVDVVPSITRVCIAPNLLSTQVKLLEDINAARKRSAFASHLRLDSVQFCIDDC
ncbi:hypothetical protein IWW52_000961, partial [Coemansia sp. RSA 2704]